MIVRVYLVGGVGRDGRGTRGTTNAAVGVTSRLLLSRMAWGSNGTRSLLFLCSNAYEPLPLTYVPATARNGWLDSGRGCGRCARARHAQCRRLYHDPVIRPSDNITVLGRGDRSTVFRDTYKIGIITIYGRFVYK